MLHGMKLLSPPDAQCVCVWVHRMIARTTIYNNLQEICTTIFFQDHIQEKTHGQKYTSFLKKKVFRGTARPQAAVARDMVRAMPERAKQIILGGLFTGTDLVQLSSEVHRPSFKD